MFLKNCWYVASWSHDLPEGELVSVQIIGQPLVLYRVPDGTAKCLANRCPHRHAPLALGRIEGGAVRCMYHGLKFDASGACVDAPDPTFERESCHVRAYPVAERDGWIWVWLGEPDKADSGMIPPGFGLDMPDFEMRTDTLDYDAHYMLINDNLTDLSHLDFVHENTLRAAMGAPWSTAPWKMTSADRRLRFERWFPNHPIGLGSDFMVDTWNAYDFYVPGVFIMHARAYPASTEKSDGFDPPLSEPIGERIEQQAVTPISDKKTRYHFGSGLNVTKFPPEAVSANFEIIMAAFAEDKRMIEAQQGIHDTDSAEEKMIFYPTDKGPYQFRKMVDRLIAAEGNVSPARKS